MTKPSTDTSPDYPTLSIDWDRYGVMLEDSDLSEDEQKEFIKTLWDITVMFVDFGYDVQSAPQICGEDRETLDQDSTDLVSLFNQEHITPAPKAK